MLVGPSNSLARHDQGIVTGAPVEHFNSVSRLGKTMRFLYDRTTDFVAKIALPVSKKFDSFDKMWFGKAMAVRGA